MEEMRYTVKISYPKKDIKSKTYNERGNKKIA